MDVNGDCVYRDHFWSFENSDANGRLDMGWANNGKLNLKSLAWKTRLTALTIRGLTPLTTLTPLTALANLGLTAV
jgi:hypothetical protein